MLREPGLGLRLKVRSHAAVLYAPSRFLAGTGHSVVPALAKDFANGEAQSTIREWQRVDPDAAVTTRKQWR